MNLALCLFYKCNFHREIRIYGLHVLSTYADKLLLLLPNSILAFRQISTPETERKKRQPLLAALDTIGPKLVDRLR
jgi:hypothetical protein